MFDEMGKTRTIMADWPEIIDQEYKTFLLFDVAFIQCFLN